MDEPTAALNDAEVDVLFELIQRFRSPETGVIYISHRMEELKRISDRITVLRDGRNIDTVVTAETDQRKVISMMVGRELGGEARPAPSRPIASRCSRARLHEAPAARRHLRGARRRDPRVRRAHGRGRTEVAVRSWGPTPGVGRDQGARPRGAHPEPGGCRAPGHRLPLRGPQAAGPGAGAQVRENIVLACEGLPRGARIRAGADRGDRPRDVRKLRVKTPSTGRSCTISPAATSRRSSSPSGWRRTARS